MHLVLVPTYNEHENICALLDALCGLKDVHVLVIDDASPDGTANDVTSHDAFGNRVFLLARNGKGGLGAAYRAGFEWGSCRPYETISQMDADFSHSPADLCRLFSAIEQGADVAIGSRKVSGGKIEGWNAWRMFCSTGAMAASRLCLGLKTKDVTAGFRTWEKSFIEKLPVQSLKSNGYAFQEEMILEAEQAGASIVEIPVLFKDREHGISKLGNDDIREFFVTLTRLTLKRRRRFMLYMSIGALGAIIDLSGFLLLHHVAHLSILSANIIATSIAVVHNFLWHHFVTFKAHGNAPHVALMKFVIISIIGIAMNSVIVLAGVGIGLWPVFAKIIAIGGVTLWNYAANSRLTFRA
ncbi:MAG: glycosyltransferase family 2 protein [Patescibacteria group bacterium]|jgi:dolichol-phosphate mannosyltransferase